MTESQYAFDYCVITASTPQQAELYKSLVQRRQDAGMYPTKLQFRFYSDPPGGRVGSGGGTLVALNELYKEEMEKSAFSSDGVDEAGVGEFFGVKRVLILHAGGESRRLPCYVPEGKLFGPLAIPSDASATHSPVVLDLVLSLYSKYPWTNGEIIMASGDVIVNFATENFKGAPKPYVRGAICGFGKAASLEQGSHHGVFAFSPNDTGEAATISVSDFHQKSSVEVLQKECLVPGTTDKCALDMGIFTMNSDWALAFFRFGAAKVDGVSVMDAVDASQLYFDFYLEIVIASLPGQSKEQYLERIGSSSKLPLPLMELAHEHLGGDKLELRGALVDDSVFLHFGTLREFPQASADAGEQSMLPFYMDGREGLLNSRSPMVRGDDGVLFTNCRVGSLKVTREAGAAKEKDIAWVEMCDSVTATFSSAGFHLLIGLQNVHLPADKPIPAGLCLDARHIDSLAGGSQIVAVYSVVDSFKAVKAADQVIFCGIAMPQWLSERGLSPTDIWSAEDAATATDLWSAKLFCTCTDAASAGLLYGYWDSGAFDKDAFLKAERFSIGDLNKNDSALNRDQIRTRHFSEMGTVQ
jgi:hypothetical protein